MKISELENRIINADCLDILRQLPEKCIDLVLTDPPYGLCKKKNSTDGKIHGKSTYHGMGKVANTYFEFKDWDNSIPEKEIFDEIFRVSKNQIIFGGNYFVEYLKNSSCWLFWDKLNGMNDFADGELAWTSFNTAVRKYEYLWNGCIKKNQAEEITNRIHPTQKPRLLFERILNDYSKEGDLILDCFSGSGTTAVACHNLRRRFICIEKDPDYFAASVERLERVQAQGLLF